MNNIAIIRQGTGRYLFSVPENVTLKEGDRVKCSTKSGITDGVAFADSVWVDENVSQLIGKLMGAKFPLKPVVGKLEYLPFEKPEDKPAEDKPIKLYCVKDYITPHGNVELIKGTVCTFNPAAGALGLPDGRRVGDATEPRSYDDWKTENPCRAACLFPLVKRPAKVGEWVLLDRDDCFHKNKQGDIVNVVNVVGVPRLTATNCFINDPTLEYSSGICVSFEDNYSYVLDGYHAEAETEPEPEYFSGKVICVSSGDECFTVGKMYEFINGEVKDDEGDARPMHADEQFKSVDEWNKAYGMPIARFIEFKGEAHD